MYADNAYIAVTGEPGLTEKENNAASAAVPRVYSSAIELCSLTYRTLSDSHDMRLLVPHLNLWLL